MLVTTILPFRVRPSALVLPMLLVASVVSAGCDLAMADLKAKETAQWSKTYQLSADATVEVNNVNGRIEVEPSTGTAVEIVAEKIAKGASSEAAKEALGRIEIQETSSPTGVRIDTKLQRSVGGLFNHDSLEVRYRVRVPAAMSVRFTTVNGGIELRGLTGRIEAETVNGGVKGREMGGTIKASTTNGGVEMDLLQIASGGAKLECVNGGIEITIPADARATVAASVLNGGIDTVGLSLQATDSSRRRLNGTLNGGGPRLELSGTNGGIRIASR
jgi:DUF4097 and DUF4098 domain-containing protein YvlB